MPSNTRPRLIAFRLKTLSVALVSALLFSNADAAGLGDLTVLSSLGQPLRAEVEVISASKQEDGPLAVKLASYEAFRQANIEFNSALLSLRFALEPRGDKQFIRITSAQAMNEPFIDMLLELSSSNGRVVREYVFLLDPASLQPMQATVTAPVDNLVPKADPGLPSQSAQSPVQAAPASSAKPAEKALATNKSAPQATQPRARNARPVQPAATPASADGKSKLRLSSVNAVSSPATGKAADATMEEYASMEKSIAEANARVKALEQKVGDLQKLLEVTNSLLAELQKQNELTKADRNPAAAAASLASADIKPADVKSDAPAAPAVAAAPAAPAPMPVAPASQPAAPKPAAAPPDSGWSSELLLLPGAALLLTLLGAFGIYTARRKKERKPFEASIFSDSSLAANSALDSTGGQRVDLGNSVFNTNFSSPAGPSSIHEVDAVSEADVYIAYGRDGQAEEVLKEALRSQPERHVLRLKLLTIYSTRKDLHSFGSLARELHGMTKGEGEDWLQAAAMGIEIDPDNPLYAGAKLPAAAAAGAGTLPVLAEPAGESAPSPATPSLEPVPQDIASLALPSSDADAGAVAADAPQAMDMPLADLMPTEEIQPVVVAPALNDLDFDLDGMSPSDTTVPTIPPAALDEPKAGAGPIDFDFALPEIPATSEPEVPPAAIDAPPAEVGLIDFDFLVPETPAAEKSETVPAREPAQPLQTPR